MYSQHSAVELKNLISVVHSSHFINSEKKIKKIAILKISKHQLKMKN